LETDEGHEVGETYENYIDVEETATTGFISLTPIISSSPSFEPDGFMVDLKEAITGL
jgi:hypothetical protein